MNSRIDTVELWGQCVMKHHNSPMNWQNVADDFAKLIVQDCADFIRETYDDKASESIAWSMEMAYGLHGDYA